MSPDQTYHSHPRQESADRPGSASSSTGFQPDHKLRAKIDKLAKWRIDPTAIEFPQDCREFQGGFGTVSRALLAVQCEDMDDWSDVEDMESDNKSEGETPSLWHEVVAVKKLKIDNEEDLERVLKMALREAGLLAELSHENIIHLEGLVEDASQAKIWLVFPWAENGNLRDFVALADWEIPERLFLIDDVARGVEYLHSHDPPICHGDLKSINVLVNSKRRAVITDFGSARRLANKGPKAQTKQIDNVATPDLVLEATVSASDGTITLTGNEYTLRWAAPEVLRDAEPGLAGDIWALGWVFYEVMTNKIPFEGINNQSAIIVNVVRGNLPRVTEHARMSLIIQLCSIMAKCWSIDPGKRMTAEGCRKGIDWMPRITPDLRRTSESTASKSRSPQLLMMLGHMLQRQSDLDNASKLYAEALEIYKSLPDLKGQAEALLNLADVHRSRHKNIQALMLYYEALDIWNELDDKRSKARVLFGLAEVHRAREDYPPAISLYKQSLDIYTDIGNKNGQVHARIGLADAHRLQKNYAEAVVLFSEAARITNETNDRYARAFALRGLAEVHRVQKEYPQAMALFSEVLQIRTEIGDKHGIGHALLSLARVHKEQDHHSDAISLYEQAGEIFKEIGDQYYVTIASWGVKGVRDGMTAA